MRTLTIRVPEEGDEPRCLFDVVDAEGRHADGLSFDEFIGQVISLTHPKLGAPQFKMLTDAQWAEDTARRIEYHEKRRQQQAQAPQLMLDALRQWRQAEQTDDPREYANAQRARDEAIARSST